MRWVPCAVTLFASLALAQDDEDEFAGAKTIAQCTRTYLPGKRDYPTAAIRGFSGQYSECTRRVMNAALDVVLVPLKKSDPGKFKLGMTAQRQFNEGVQRYCGRWNEWYADCCSTCSYTEQPECMADFHAARVSMLSKPLVDGAAKRERTTAEFAAFAASWCEFTAGGEGCAGRVLATLESMQRDDGKPLSCRASKK